MEEIKDLGAATSSSRLPAACKAAAVSSKVPDLIYPVLMFALAQEDDISFLITHPPEIKALKIVLQSRFSETPQHVCLPPSAEILHRLR